jgi:hypothetical protein
MYNVHPPCKRRNSAILCPRLDQEKSRVIQRTSENIGQVLLFCYVRFAYRIVWGCRFGLLCTDRVKFRYGGDVFMPGCVLRASGDEFDPYGFLSGSAFQPCNVFRKGERRGKSSTWTTSGFTLEVSAASGSELDVQIQDALEFLRINREDIVRLTCWTGVEDVRLDFGLSRNHSFLQCSYLPPELLELAGTMKVGIEISIYWDI